MPVTITDSATLGRTSHWQVTIEERRQYIDRIAQCIDCGAERMPPTDDGVPDFCPRRSGMETCRYRPSQKLTDELLREVVAGEVRTVAEAYPPPRQGPLLPGYDWLLHQGIWWYPYRRPAVRVAEMDKPHRFNTARFIERRAADLHMTVGMRYMGNAPDDVWHAWEREDPVGWLRRTPLLRALRKGLPGGGAKLRALEVRALHWHTCPMRLAHPGALDSCMCVREGGRVIGATNDPYPAPVRRRPTSRDLDGRDEEWRMA
jgi:hypothetical protein